MKPAAAVSSMWKTQKLSENLPTPNISNQCPCKPYNSRLFPSSADRHLPQPQLLGACGEKRWLWGRYRTSVQHPAQQFEVVGQRKTWSPVKTERLWEIDSLLLQVIHFTVAFVCKWNALFIRMWSISREGLCRCMLQAVPASTTYEKTPNRPKGKCVQHRRKQ